MSRGGEAEDDTPSEFWQVVWPFFEEMIVLDLGSSFYY